MRRSASPCCATVGFAFADEPLPGFAFLGTWLRALVTEAQCAFEAERRYIELRHSDPTALALQGCSHRDVPREIFEEFYSCRLHSARPAALAWRNEKRST